MQRIEARLQELREEYQTATNERRKQILILANKLKESSKLCYECKEKEYEEQDDPFCSESCHKKWADKNYPVGTRDGKKRPTIEQMQKRLHEMAKEMHLKSKTETNGQMKI